MQPSTLGEIVKQKDLANLKRHEFGQYLVADPNICHGRLTFKGTRLFVEDVLDMVSKGMNWDDIIWECHGSITREAIMEAVSIAGKAFIESKEKNVPPGQMLLVDEHVLGNQRDKLVRWNFPVRQIGRDLGVKGMDDYVGKTREETFSWP